MGDILSNLVNWMASLPDFWAYAMILGVAYTENVIPPIPGDMIVVFGGYMVGLGTLEMSSVVILATIGGALGFMTMYAVGRRIGLDVLSPRRFAWLSESRVRKVRQMLNKWGFGLVAANRFLSGLRSVISLTVGMSRMRPWETLFFATVSALLWTSLLAVAGYLVGDNWAVVETWLRNYGWFVSGILLLAVLAVAAKRRRRRSRAVPEAGEDTGSRVN
jgi:membrane protein DedA with SNARE-associated domain